MAHNYKGELKKDLLGGQVNRSFFFFLSCQILQIILLVGVMLQGGENGVPDRKQVFPCARASALTAYRCQSDTLT